MSLFASKTTEKKRNVYYDFVTVASCIQELNSEKIDEKLRQHFRKEDFWKETHRNRLWVKNFAEERKFKNLFWKEISFCRNLVWQLFLLQKQKSFKHDNLHDTHCNQNKHKDRQRRRRYTDRQTNKQRLNQRLKDLYCTKAPAVEHHPSLYSLYLKHKARSLDGLKRASLIIIQDKKVEFIRFLRTEGS